MNTEINILPLTYLGNIQYFTKLCFTDCIVDIHEHYVKQSYRTRCDILTANGPASLVINTVRGSNFNKTTVKDTRIDYSKRWQHQHWQSLVSSYRSSPYFDYFADMFAPFYEERYEFLLDFNTRLAEVVLRLLGIENPEARIRFSEKYMDTDKLVREEPGIKYTDLRDAISPKPRLARPDPFFAPEPYWQVFSEKINFVPNLSITDLLFCEGMHSLEILRKCLTVHDCFPADALKRRI